MVESDDGYLSGTAYDSSNEGNCDGDVFEIQRMHARAPSSNPCSDRGSETVWDEALLATARLLLPAPCFRIIAMFLDA